MMNSYERYINMAKGQKCDIVPRIPILMHFAASHIGRTYADFARDPRVFTEAKTKVVADFDFDQLDLMSDPWREATAFGAELEYQSDTVPKCTFRPLENTKNLDTLLRPNSYKSERMKTALDIVTEFKRLAWEKYSITGWVEGPAAEAADLRGVENFLIDLIDDQKFASDLMRLCVDNAIAFAHAQIEKGCDTIGIGDAIASLVSPQIYERLILSEEIRLVKAIKQKGGLARLHICGNISNLLPLITQLQIDIIDCDWMVDIEKARKILGDRVVLTGNLDPVNAVLRSTPKQIRQDVQNIYKKIGNPYYVNAGCEIPVGTPHENLKALCTPILAT